ncbi:hypothetical protein [Paraburkholderia sp. BL17N1]|uniref:hypothetical protein n=1 Tax=Paraburkholderia sp. BL17N1 TaxID=1938798 RepID=UPI000F1AF033|nr:hypothetical protein [Paraburkholderia sp. BL17N1]RKR45930.1 hypothetical protein B0G82_3595 [Paraburkholderia sp. BL17N1]
MDETIETVLEELKEIQQLVREMHETFRSDFVEINAQIDRIDTSAKKTSELIRQPRQFR